MVLSDVDIRKELIDGENIMIFPLKLENVKGSSINLTASKYAWRISDNNSAIVDDKIRIPANETVCIYTEESVWVSRRIAGTYYSKVSQVSEGMGHISTTLDPQFLGLSLIAVNNPSNNPIDIVIGTTFVTLMFHYLKTPATRGKNENSASRQDLSSSFKLSDGEKEYLRKDVFRSYEGLKAAMLSSPNYEILTEERDREIQAEKQKVKEKKEFKKTFWYPLIIGLVGAIVGGAISVTGNIIVEVYLK